MYVSSRSRTRQALLSVMVSSFCIWPKWSSHSTYHLTQTLPQELWITEYTSRASTLRVNTWKTVRLCVFSVCNSLAGEIQSCEEEKQRRGDQLIFDWLLSGPVLACCNIDVVPRRWGRLSRAHRYISTLLANVSPPWPPSRNKQCGMNVMTICLCICTRTCLGIYTKVKVSTDWQVQTSLQQRYTATVIIWWWMSDNCW